MNNNDVLEKLTIGKDLTETVTINDTDIELRPLTSGELAKLKSMETKGLKMNVPVNQQGKRMQDVEVDAGVISEQRIQTMYQAIAWSMGIKKEKIEQFKVGVPEKIFEEVQRE